MNEEISVKIREVSFEGILRPKDVETVTGLSRVTLWREEKAGRFPARVQLTRNRVGWVGSEIREWIDSRPRVVKGETE